MNEIKSSDMTTLSLQTTRYVQHLIHYELLKKQAVKRSCSAV